MMHYSNVKRIVLIFTAMIGFVAECTGATRDDPQPKPATQKTATKKADGPALQELPVEETLAALIGRAEALTTARSFREAEAAWRKVHAASESQLGADHWETRRALLSISGALRAQSKFAESEALLRQAMAADEKWRPDNWTTFNLTSGLGDYPLREARELAGRNSAAAQKKFQEAESLMLAGYQGMKARADRMGEWRQQRLSEAILRLIQLNDAWKKPAEAAKWRKELDALAKEQPK